jgi:hypothetical protein
MYCGVRKWANLSLTDMTKSFIIRILAPVALAVLVLAANGNAQNPLTGDTCPLDFLSVKFTPPMRNQSSVITDAQGILYVKFKNVSGREIKSATLKAASHAGIVGPTQRTSVSTVGTIRIDGPFKAMATKRKKIKISLKSSDYHVIVSLTGVMFSDGQRWTNDDQMLCASQSTP